MVLPAPGGLPIMMIVMAAGRHISSARFMFPNARRQSAVYLFYCVEQFARVHHRGRDFQPVFSKKSMASRIPFRRQSHHSCSQWRLPRRFPASHRPERLLASLNHIGSTPRMGRIAIKRHFTHDDVFPNFGV
jgi:hypothetical protein